LPANTAIHETGRAGGSGWKEEKLGQSILTGCPELVDFGFRRTGLGGDNGWGYNHSDKGEGDQEVMHLGGLLG